MIPNPNVFREYDIRGLAARDFPDDFIKALGRALGTFWQRRGCKRVAVGRDCRLSSPRIHAALMAGLTRCGLDIIDIGMVPSPLLYFTVFHYDLDGGVEITGSHNPPDDNGFKIMLGKAGITNADILELREMLGPHPVRFAMDAGSGAGGPMALLAMKTVGLQPISLLCEPDGHFPVHHPDPSLPENLALLISTVREHNLDFGIAFDGDADRIGVVDRKGNVVFGDKLLIIYARALLARHPGAPVLGEVKCSQVLYDDIAKRGGRPVLWKTGHSLIKKKMKEEHALLAGEMSGHVFFADRFFGFDDAIYAALRFVEIATHTGLSIEALLEGVPETFSTPELRVDCSDETKFDVVNRVLAHYKPTNRIVDVDGARILFDDGAWGLVRASNTQPVLVLRFEAYTEARMNEIRADIEGVVTRARASMGA
jgi:phosphomannomutase/phosphoglucomutase